MAEQGFDWGALGAAGLNAAGAYFQGGQYGQSQNAQVSGMSPMTGAWTQLLGLNTIAGFEQNMNTGNAGLMQGYGNAASMTSALPGIAQQGTQAQLGVMADAEGGAIQHALKSQKAQLGQVQQGGASSGFYGNSAQAGMEGQVYANANQTIADIMAGTAQAKAGIIGQGTAAQMQGVSAAAQGQQALGEAFAKASGAEYNLMKDKLNTVLSTANSWGVGEWEMKNLIKLTGGLSAQGQAWGKNLFTGEIGGQHVYPISHWKQSFADWLAGVDLDQMAAIG